MPAPQPGLNTVLISGHALLPKDSSLYERFRVITCVLEVDADGCIVDVEFSTIMTLTNSYLKKLLIGHNLHDGVGPLAERVAANCILDSVKAFARALCNAHSKWSVRYGVNEDIPSPAQDQTRVAGC